MFLIQNCPDITNKNNKKKYFQKNFFILFLFPSPWSRSSMWTIFISKMLMIDCTQNENDRNISYVFIKASWKIWKIWNFWNSWNIWNQIIHRACFSSKTPFIPWLPIFISINFNLSQLWKEIFVFYNIFFFFIM